MQRIGLISDTHGLLRPAALEFLRGCDHIIHAGDIGAAALLQTLGELAPVSAVRGNNDRQAEFAGVPETTLVRIDATAIYVLHDLKQLAVAPGQAGIHVVVSGHSHRPRVEQREGVLYVNPGSAGRRRFALPVCVGELLIDGCEVTPRLVELDG